MRHEISNPPDACVMPWQRLQVRGNILQISAVVTARCPPFLRQPDDRLLGRYLSETRTNLPRDTTKEPKLANFGHVEHRPGCLQGIRYKTLSSAADTCVVQHRAGASTTRGNFYNLHRLLIYTANSGNTWNVPCSVPSRLLSSRIIIASCTMSRAHIRFRSASRVLRPTAFLSSR